MTHLPLRRPAALVAALALAASLGAMSDAADAKGRKPVIKLPAGTTVNDLCEKEKVQKCRWEGQQKICEWVDGPNCRIY